MSTSIVVSPMGVEFEAYAFQVARYIERSVEGRMQVPVDRVYTESWNARTRRILQLPAIVVTVGYLEEHTQTVTVKTVDREFATISIERVTTWLADELSKAAAAEAAAAAKAAVAKAAAAETAAAEAAAAEAAAAANKRRENSRVAPAPIELAPIAPTNEPATTEPATPTTAPTRIYEYEQDRLLANLFRATNATPH